MTLPPPTPGSMPPPPPPGWTSYPVVLAPTARLRPAWWWYLIAGALAIVAVVVGIVTMGLTLVNYVDSFHRIDYGTTEVVDLDSGGYTIYAERTSSELQVSRSDVLGAVRVTDPNGNRVSLDDYYGSNTYNVGSRHGRAVLTFHADESGPYRIAVGGEPSSEFGSVVIGQGFRSVFGRAVRRGLLAGTIGIAFAVALAVFIGVKRGQDRRRHSVGVP